MSICPIAELRLSFQVEKEEVDNALIKMKAMLKEQELALLI